MVKRKKQVAELEKQRKQLGNDLGEALRKYEQEKTARYQAEQQLVYRKETKAEVSVISVDWQHNKHVESILCEHHGVGAWFNRADMKIWRTDSFGNQSVMDNNPTYVFENVPTEAFRVEGNDCSNNHYKEYNSIYGVQRVVQRVYLSLQNYTKFLEGAEWVRVTLSGFDDNKNPVSVTITHFDQ